MTDTPRPHVLVVGGGIAGITAALHAERAGARVTLVTKGALGEANTREAQGGIAAAVFDDDSVASHGADTLAAGAGLGDVEAVRVLVTEGPERVAELIELGVAFDRTADGSLRRGLEAAHSKARILHAGGDATGAAIEEALVATLKASDVEVIEHAFLTGLALDGARVTGAEFIGTVTGELSADAVILATGGIGRLFDRTTNPPVATGDGIAAALRAGAAVADLEFIQFHPTVLDTAEPFLVSEAVRGEGAVLRDRSGHAFARRFHPDGELAPRDVVARAMATVIREQDGAPVLLDATSIGRPETARTLAERFPTIDAAVRARGLDWAREPIPVAPAAHYLMGGIVTDLDGRTTLPGLYAVGETARTGVHGANRLASNSLLEGAVFGARAGDAAVADVRDARAWPTVTDAGATASTRVEDPSEYTGAASDPEDDGDELKHPIPPFTRAALQRLMSDEVGLVRDADGLARAAALTAAWATALPAPRTPTEWEDANLLLVARAVIRAASARRESVGAHFRADDSADFAPRDLGSDVAGGVANAVGNILSGILR